VIEKWRQIFFRKRKSEFVAEVFLRRRRVLLLHAPVEHLVQVFVVAKVEAGANVTEFVNCFVR
jgi:hypothetical protein